MDQQLCQEKQVIAVSQQALFDKDTLPWQAKPVWRPAGTRQLEEGSSALHAKERTLLGQPLGNGQFSWFKIKIGSFHPPLEWQAWSSQNLSLLEVTQEGRTWASAGLAGKTVWPCWRFFTAVSPAAPSALRVRLRRENTTGTDGEQGTWQVFYSCSSTNKTEYANTQFQEDSKRSKKPLKRFICFLRR